MKILMIVSAGYIKGGIESYVTLIRPILEEQGHIVKILSSDECSDVPHFSDYEYKVPSGAFRYLSYTFNVHAYCTLKRIIREFAPDVVHIETIGHASPSILFALDRANTFMTIHGPEAFVESMIVLCQPLSDFRDHTQDKQHLRLIGKVRYFYYRYIIGFLYRRALRRVKVMVTPSLYMQRLVAESGYENICILNGTTLFSSDTDRDAWRDQTIVFAGRLEKFKGVDVLLRAFPAILERFPKAHLMLAGDGDEREYLENLSARLGIASAVEFMGRIDRKGIEELFRRSSIVVMPSVWVEAFGLVGIEAMSVGRPVVASHIGGIPDWLVDGETGYLVPPGDHTELSGAIIKLLSNPELFRVMMKKARLRAECFDVRVHISQIIALYQSTLSKGLTKGE